MLKKNIPWDFNTVVNKFDNHISKSVPGYKECQNIVSDISVFFIKKNSTIYDIGCSTGTLTKLVYKKNIEKKVNSIAYDISGKMIKYAKLKKSKIKFIKKNIMTVNFKKSDFISSMYTIQFLHPKDRQVLINKIYKSLNWGGAFIFFEKIRGKDARFQDLLNFLLFDYKKKNKINPKNILLKEKSLRGIMEPYTLEQNISYIKNAGFNDYMTIYQNINFVGILAIK